MDKSTLQFLKSLKSNNNKEWMDANKKTYQNAKADFEDFVAQLIPLLGKMDDVLAGLEPKQCIFRLNRDIRFSNDKSPYKTHFGAVFCRGGRKSPDAGYYFHLEPGASFAGGGIWMPDPNHLRSIRQEIDYNFAGFTAVIQEKKFKKFFPKIEGDALVRPPKGYEESNPAIEYLKKKNFTIGTSLPDKDLTSPSLVKTTGDIFETMRPFIDFLNHAVG